MPLSEQVEGKGTRCDGDGVVDSLQAIEVDTAGGISTFSKSRRNASVTILQSPSISTPTVLRLTTVHKYREPHGSMGREVWLNSSIYPDSP